ncbi:MAG: M23 family metallopeptidase [Lachnospiraceae bacterium]|nr:M23 family metallopeptidase [Lachnospiraceae bacterium]
MCLLLSVLLLACLIEGELFWLDGLLETQIPEESNTRSEFEEYGALQDSVWEELSCFPVPESETNTAATVSFENTWHAERTYGGTRSHEGIDIMADLDKSGYYPVLSMTDGTVEKVGWLEKGGWRIGIRSGNGNYYYYAHLHSYAKKWLAGDRVYAGEILGYMGDSGYGEEGTTGKFPVHLHVGIYIPLGADQETAVNPYWMLRYLENRKLRFTY